MNQKTYSGDAYRYLALLFIFLAIGVPGLLMLGHPLDRAAIVTAVVPCLLMLAPAVLLWVLASVYDVVATRNRSVDQTQRDIHSLSVKFEEISERVAKLRPQGPTPAAALQVSSAPVTPVPAPTPTSTSTVPDANLVATLQNIMRQIEEVRSLSLLTDDERRNRHSVLAEEFKLQRQRNAVDAIDSREWSKADKLLGALEAEYPHDGQIAHLRVQLSRSRQEVEARTVTKMVETVEEYMTASWWDQAYTAARRLTDDFPTNTIALDLMERVCQGRDLHRDSTAQQLFEEIRQQINLHAWRDALTLATRMLEKFPDHRRTEKIRQQFQTIQDNAEIQERQELEVRIQELIREQQFDQATALGEEMMQRYPASPQAGSLEVLLPKIRQLAEEQHNAVA